MYPSSQPGNRNNRVKVDSELGSFYAGTLYDLMHVKTAGASGQAATIGNEMESQLGAPAGSTGIYSFSNPGNSSATCIFMMWWEELPVK